MEMTRRESASVEERGEGLGAKGMGQGEMGLSKMR